MARLARVVVPKIPHHVTQRGNRRQRVFFSSDDYQEYLRLMAEWCSSWDVEIWAYCLMPNHVHLIAVPARCECLRRAIGEVHRRYTRHINFREGWRGYLWQGRFASYPMDTMYLFTAARYIENNPVRTGLVAVPDDYEWSSAKAHVSGRDDDLVKVLPLLAKVSDWRAFLTQPLQKHESETLRRHVRTGRPLGSDSFIEDLERGLGRTLRPQKPARRAVGLNPSRIKYCAAGTHRFLFTIVSPAYPPARRNSSG